MENDEYSRGMNSDEVINYIFDTARSLGDEVYEKYLSSYTRMLFKATIDSDYGRDSNMMQDIVDGWLAENLGEIRQEVMKSNLKEKEATRKLK